MDAWEPSASCLGLGFLKGLIEGYSRVHNGFMVRGSHLPFHFLKFLISVNLGRMRSGNLGKCKFLQMLEFGPKIFGGCGFGHFKNWQPQYRLIFMIGTPEGNPL